MEKTSSPDKTTTSSQGRSSTISIVAALASALLFTLLAGYLTLQLQLSEIHAVIGFDSRPVAVSGDWLPYVWQLSLVVLALAAVMVYSLIIRGTVARLIALATLAVVAILGSPVASGTFVANEQYPLGLAIAWTGAKSHMILALIGAGVVSLILDGRKTRAR